MSKSVVCTIVYIWEKLMDILRTFVYEMFLENFYGKLKIKKKTNFLTTFYIIVKIVSKFFQNLQLTNFLREINYQSLYILVI